MTQLVGKIIPGVAATTLAIYGLRTGDLDTATTCILGFMAFWGMSTAYYPILDGIDGLRDHVHMIAAKKLGIEP